MANEFENLSSDPVLGPKKPELLSYQNIYDALREQDPLVNRSGVFLPDGGFAKTPDDLKNLLGDQKAINNFFDFYKNNPKFKTFGVSDSQTLFQKLNAKSESENKSFAWTPSVNKVEKIETYGLEKLNPAAKSDDSENEKKLIFKQLATSGLNVNSNGKQIGTVEEFENFTYDPDAWEKWVSENRDAAIEAGVNPYAVRDTFQKNKEKKTGDLDTKQQSYDVDVANGELTNSIALNYGLNEEEIGRLVDESFTNPSFAMDISNKGKSFYNDETGETQDLKNITMSDLFEDAVNRGLSEEEAFSYLNSFRGKYLDNLAKEQDYINNASAKTYEGAPETLGSKNAYQVGMDKEGFDMLDDSFKNIATAYGRLDELTKISQTLKKEGAFKQEGRLLEIEEEIVKQKQLISKLQKEADVSTAVIYDPIQRVPIEGEAAKAAISKASSKYTEEYYARTLFGEMKKQRNSLSIQVKNLQERILSDVERLSKRQELGIVGPETQNDQLALQANRDLYIEKYAELITLNKGIYTNSNPLKRDSEYVLESAARVFNRDYLGGKDFYSKITPADEAYQLSKFMQNKGFYVSEKDLLKTKETVGEMIGSGLPATVQAMLEIALYEAVGNYAGGAVAASRYFTAAKEFIKLKYGKSGTRLFEMFVEGGMELAIKEGAYVVAGQSAAGALGEIGAEKAFDAIAISDKFKNLMTGKNRYLYILGRYLSGTAGETLAEVSGNIADLMTEYGYDIRKAFDLSTRDGQFQVILGTSALLTAPGDIKTAFKTQQKFQEEIISRGAENIDPLTMEYSRLLDQVLEQTPATAETTQEEDLQPVEPDLPQEVVDMGEGPIEEPEVSEQIPQEKANEVKNKERLEVEKRKADLGEEFHIVEADGTIDKRVTYKYDEKTGNLQSKGYSRFNSSWKDVNSEHKAEVESKASSAGMLSKSKGLEIAKQILGIDENSKLVYKDGKLYYSKDQLQKNASENIKNVKSSAKDQVKRLDEKAKAIKENVFADVEDAYSTSPTSGKAAVNDAPFNKFLQVYKAAFGGKLRTNFHSLFFNGAKFNPDARKGIPRISDYIAPILDRFSRTGSNANIVNRVVSNIINSTYFKDSLGSDLAYLETEGLTSDAAMTLISDVLLDSHDDVLDNIFDGDEIKIQEFKTLRDNLNQHIQKEYIGKQSNSNSPAFYNNRMEEVSKKTTDSEMAMTAKQYRVAEEEKRQIQNTGKMARGEDYSADEINSIRYLQGKIGASEFLNSLNEPTENLTEEEIKSAADKRANELNVYENFKGYQEKLADFKKTRKARISKIKKNALDKNFDFETYGVGATTKSDNLAVQLFNAAVIKPLKLNKQKDYAAKLMNTMIEFAALRAGMTADDFLDTKLHFDNITKEELASLEGGFLYSKDGELEIAKILQDNSDFVDGMAEISLLNANGYIEAGIDPTIVYYATGWYKSAAGTWMYKYGHPNKLVPLNNNYSTDVIEKIKTNSVSRFKLSDYFNIESLRSIIPNVEDLSLIFLVNESPGVKYSKDSNLVLTNIEGARRSSNEEFFTNLVRDAVSEVISVEHGLGNIKTIKSKEEILQFAILELLDKNENSSNVSEFVKLLKDIFPELYETSKNPIEYLQMSLEAAKYNSMDIYPLTEGVSKSVLRISELIEENNYVRALYNDIVFKNNKINLYYRFYQNNLNFQNNPTEFLNSNPLSGILSSVRYVKEIEQLERSIRDSEELLNEVSASLLENTFDFNVEEIGKLKAKVKKLSKKVSADKYRYDFLNQYVFSDTLREDVISSRLVFSNMLLAFSENVRLTEVQKQKILNFANKVKQNYLPDVENLIDLGILELGQELNDRGFDTLLAELNVLQEQTSRVQINILKAFNSFLTDYEGNTNALIVDKENSSPILNKLKELRNKNFSEAEIKKISESTYKSIENLYGERLLKAKEQVFQETLQKYSEFIENPKEFLEKFLENSETKDESGNPILLYRGANSLYSTENDTVFYTTRVSKAASYLGVGIDVGQSFNVSVGTGSNLRTSYIKIENPAVIDAQGARWNQIPMGDILGELCTDSIVQMVKDVKNGVASQPQIDLVNTYLKNPNSNPDGVIFKNIIDYGIGVVRSSAQEIPGDVYVSLESKNVILTGVTLFQGDATIRAAVNLNKHGKSIIYAVTNPNVSSPLHEMAHVLEDYLSDSEKQAVLEFAGETDWNVNTSEVFARGFEKYLMDGVSPTKQMETVFEKFKAWLTEIYTALGLENLGQDLNPQMRSIYNTIFGVSEPDVKEETNTEDELFDFIESQREQKISDDQIYKGLIEAGYKPEDVSEYFTLRTKQTVLSQMASKGEFSEAARSIANDTVTVKRTFGEILQELGKLDELEIDVVLANLENMQDLDKALVAKILLMRKMRGEGKDISQELSEIAEIGTNAGRILQRMKMLKKDMEDQTLANIMRELDKRDISIPPRTLQRLKKLATAVSDARSKYESAKDAAAKYPMEVSATNPRMTNYENALDLREQYQNIRFMFFKEIRDYARKVSYSDLYQTLVRGNLLTTGSMVINMTSNAAKTIVNIPVNILAGGIGVVKHKFFGTELVTYRGVGYYKNVLNAYGKAWNEMTKTIAMGSIVEDANGLEINRGFNGFRALRDSFGMLMGAIDGSNRSLTDEQFAEKYKLPLDKNGNVMKKAVLHRVAEGVFGFAAEANFRALGGPDAFFKTTAYWGALYEQGKTLGLSDVKDSKLGGRSQLQMFMELNADYSNEPAMAEALKLIYANDGMLYKGFQTIFGTKTGGNKIIKSLITTQIPFQKIPSNVAQEFFMFAVPELGLASSAWKNIYQIPKLNKEIEATKIPSQRKKLRDEKRRIQRDSEIDLSRAVVAYGLHYAANLIIQQLAISGSASPTAGVDDKERRWKEEFRPADYINVTLLLENAKKEPSKKRKDWLPSDYKIQLRDLGMFGAILSMKQTAIEKYNRDAKVVDLVDVHTGFEDNMFTDISNAVPYLLDQTMVKGIGDIVNLVFETESDAWANFTAGFANTMATAIAPNHLNQITKLFREFDVDYRPSPEDKEQGFQYNFTKTLKNRLKEKAPFVFDNDYVVRYDVTGKPRRQKGKMVDPVLDFFGIKPQRRETGIDHTIQEISNILKGDKKPEWKDLIYIGFVYGDAKAVIPPDIPRSIEASAELGIKKSLSEEEKEQFREELNPIREGLVNKVINGVNFKSLLDLDSPYNKRSDGSRITFGDKNMLLGYYVLSDILSNTYTQSQSIIETTLGPSIINKALEKLTPEQKAVIDKITAENVAGAVFKKVEENKDLTTILKNQGLRISDLFKGQLIQDEQLEQPKAKPKRPKVTVNGIDY
jgi:hypothetical protein